MTLTMPFDPASSVQAARLAWAIERYAEGELTAEQVESTHEFDPGYDTASQLRRFQVFRRPIDGVISAELTGTSPRAIVRSGPDEAIVRVRLGDAPEHRILAMVLMKCPAPGVTTRLAAEADGPALRDLERRCAVETGGVSVYYDRGDDYFAQQRLMPHHVSIIAEYQGRVVGVMSDAFHYICVGGVPYRATYRFHLRVDPTIRGVGILPAMNIASGDATLVDRPLPVASSFIAAENTQMMAIIGDTQRDSMWPTPIERMSLSCAAIAGDSFGRAATPGDAKHIAGLMAASHGAEEATMGFDERSVTDRLTRSPADYTWCDVALSDDAVLGVWDLGLRIVRTDASGTSDVRTATALDWGFAPGAEGQMEALLQSACAKLAGAGVDDLIIFTSPPSRGRDLLARLAHTIEPFRVYTAGPVPTEDAVHGVYVDPVYF